MITVISGTDRPGSVTLSYAQYFTEVLQELAEPTQLLDMQRVALGAAPHGGYDAATLNPGLKALQETYILGSEKMVFVVPEYNGSFPGVVKHFIDRISVNEYARNFKGKFMALIGISSGRAGNLRGMDHLADSLAHMGGWVLPNRLPISGADVHLADGELVDTDTIAQLKILAEQLISA